MDKLELLFSHYKDSNDLSKKAIKDRNRYFIILAILSTVLFLFASDTNAFLNTLKEYATQNLKVNIYYDIDAIQTLLWLITLFYTIRYCQTSIYVERLYNYIHKLEKDITSICKYEFDREGKSYLDEYPTLLNFVSIMYKWIFPIMYLLVLLTVFILEVFNHSFSISQLFDSIIFLCIVILSTLYEIFVYKNN